jgi:hypothetical protein
MKSARAADATAAKQAVVVLVLDQPVSKQLQAYWMQLLRRAGVEEPETHIRYASVQQCCCFMHATNDLHLVMQPS